MEITTRVQILDNAVCVSFYANVFGKGINISSLYTSDIVKQVELFNLRKTTVYKEDFGSFTKTYPCRTFTQIKITDTSNLIPMK